MSPLQPLPALSFFCDAQHRVMNNDLRDYVSQILSLIALVLLSMSVVTVKSVMR